MRMDALCSDITAKFGAVMADNNKLREKIDLLEERLRKLEKAPTSQLCAKTPPPQPVPTRNQQDTYTAGSCTPSRTNASHDLASLIAEEIDISGRKTNLVVRGIPDSRTHLKRVCSELFVIPDSAIISAERLGKETTADGNSDSNLPVQSGRPVRVQFATTSDKVKFNREVGLHVRT